MKIERLYKKGSILTPVLAGGTVGAGLGLLLAPQSGFETRKDIEKIASRVTHAFGVGKDLYALGKKKRSNPNCSSLEALQTAVTLSNVWICNSPYGRRLLPRRP